MSQQIMRIPRKMRIVLKRLYGKPASVTLITGLWKTGKTDWGLKLTELTQELNLIKEFAGNVETVNSYIQFINDFRGFDLWAYSNRHPKMFLYDEAVESSPRRKAMSSINVGWVQRIPQLSKGKIHLIVLVQEENLADSIFLNPTFLRGIWRKLEKTTLKFDARWLETSLKWFNIPRTKIQFDPYLGATFKLENPQLQFDMLPMPLKVLELYAKGNSFTDIQRILNIDHPQTVRRYLISACRAVSLTISQQPTEGNLLKQKCEEY